MESGKGHTKRGVGQHKALKPDSVCPLEKQEAGVRGALEVTETLGGKEVER